MGQQIKYDKVQRSESKGDLRVKAMGDLPEEGSAERLIAPQRSSHQTGDELYFYTRGGQAAASGMKGRNEMSRRICSGWFDTRQVLARVQTRSSGFPATS